MPRILMIVDASIRDEANQLGALFQTGETFTSPVSSTGKSPATHYLAEGEIPVPILAQIETAASELIASGAAAIYDLATTTKTEVLNERGLRPCVHTL